jgi:hypothetical protein
VLFGAPYVPSHRREVRRSFERLYPLNSKDVLVDLGSGDGVVLAEAVRRGARAYGYELNPLLVWLSRFRLGKRATVTLGNMWKVQLPAETTLVYIFMVTRDSPKAVRYFKAEVTRLNKPLTVMTYGEGLRDLTAKASLRGHTLYEIKPRT